MNDPETYDAVVIGGGKGGKTLAMYLARQNYKVAMIERDPMMVGGGCINLACIPTKTFIASARLVHSIRRAAEFGIKVEGFRSTGQALGSGLKRWCQRCAR
jgi:pyruvate/2-oxoglutarate dehydrogenase complex dihydrolipoamide dehydrogenase (E3) component